MNLNIISMDMGGLDEMVSVWLKIVISGGEFGDFWADWTVHIYSIVVDFIKISRFSWKYEFVTRKNGIIMNQADRYVYSIFWLGKYREWTIDLGMNDQVHFINFLAGNT